MIIESIKASAPLDRFVSCFWVLEKLSQSHTELVYPTGKIQFLFHYGSPFTSLESSGAASRQHRFSIFGQQTSYSNVTASSSSGLVAVVLYPQAAAAFFPFSLSEITGSTVEVYDALPGWKLHEEAFLSCTDTPSRIDVIEKFLLSEISIKNPVRYSMIGELVKHITAGKGSIPIYHLAEHFDISERTVERIFTASVGISPKQFSDIIKLNNAIDLCVSGLSLADISQVAGYYDQSHFNCTIKRYTGFTPSEIKNILHS